MTPRWATAAIFAVNGAAIGIWVAQIPAVQQRFDLGNAAIGLLIASMAAAVVAIMPIAGHLVARRGSRRVVGPAGLACALAINLPVLAGDPALVALGLFVLGGASATMDVAMNSHGVKVEQKLRRPIMSSLHAGWAFGGMAGAAVAAAGAALGVDSRATVAVASGLLALAVAGASGRIGEGAPAHGTRAPTFALPSRGVALLAMLCLLVMVTEGAMADWGGVYLRQDLGAGSAVAAAAYSFFAGGMTLGRVVGDAVNRRIGPVALLRWGAGLTGLALGATLALDHPAVALIGLFAVGVGVANGVPVFLSAAGRRPGARSGPAIAAVASMGSLGFLAGPPLIGLLADAVTLPWALATLVLGTLALFALARRAAGEERAAPAGTVSSGHGSVATP